MPKKYDKKQLGWAIAGSIVGTLAAAATTGVLLVRNMFRKGMWVEGPSAGEDAVLDDVLTPPADVVVDFAALDEGPFTVARGGRFIVLNEKGASPLASVEGATLAVHATIKDDEVRIDVPNDFEPGRYVIRVHRENDTERQYELDVG